MGRHVHHWATAFAESVDRRRAWIIVGTIAGALAAGYLLVFFVFFTTGYHLRTINNLIVLLSMLIATVVPAWIAFVGVGLYRLPGHLRRRESLGWWLIAAGSLLNLVARSIHAYQDAFAADPSGSLASANVFFVVAYGFYVAGLLLIPWSEGLKPGYAVLADIGLVFLSVGTLLWPLLIGPAWRGSLGTGLSQTTVTFSVLGVSLLLFVILWMMMRDVRRELWPTAVWFVAAISMLVVLLVVLYSPGDQYGLFPAEPIRLLATNVLTSIVAGLVLIASLARLSSVRLAIADDDRFTPHDQHPIHFWQIILPYPIVLMVIIVRLGMQAFDWRMEYTAEMVPGIAGIAVLIMFRQLQMLRHNHALFLSVSNSALRDGLTDLYNHRSLQDLLQRQIHRAERRRQDESIAVLFIDIDRFKHFNDTYGHPNGDQVLVRVADLLTERCRSADLVGRYGGEEFLVIAPDIDRDGAVALGERLRHALVSQEFVFEDDRVDLTMSVGIAMYPDDSTDRARLIEKADQAMYRAKQMGRNRTVAWRASAEISV